MDNNYIILYSTLYTFNVLIFRHRPIRLTKPYNNGSRRGILSALEDNERQTESTQSAHTMEIVEMPLKSISIKSPPSLETPLSVASATGLAQATLVAEEQPRDI
ncbi:hypothetical protein SODALDRAFT_323548 [Sodiomyces alkalinus F11]|uniref:Uncharacterized protein n=1 Tax=Sodiomyces alkalinus (strain CBS 110278 / VKM F-3762 / F11) TaxID=1314773 RepID=A0A3N2PX93_SODAK|nr:hypothetical protein SODALDRAFT_323548 [Sodiomyces alkalinus F11]ROT39088.1 hypothetical protein SODALDRAFT_323548 [Sodiomyces alkalinus F11]